MLYNESVGGKFMNILQKIDELRKERGWSINNLAMEAMLTQSTLNNLYNRGNEPKISTLTAICNAFGITLAEFFNEEISPINEDENLSKQLDAKIKRLNVSQKYALLQFLKTI